jgi:hypothetical protein
MKAENILKKLGIAILLIPAPRALSTDCGLAIRFSSDQLDTVMCSLTDGNLTPAIIYKKISDSEYQTIWEPENSVSP